MGHEAIGIVEDVGADVHSMKPGQLLIMPFAFSDGRCQFCDEGLTTACVHGGFFGTGGGTAAPRRRCCAFLAPTGPSIRCLSRPTMH